MNATATWKGVPWHTEYKNTGVYRLLPSQQKQTFADSAVEGGGGTTKTAQCTLYTSTCTSQHYAQ